MLSECIVAIIEVALIMIYSIAVYLIYRASRSSKRRYKLYKRLVTGYEVWGVCILVDCLYYDFGRVCTSIYVILIVLLFIIDIKLTKKKKLISEGDADGN